MSENELKARVELALQNHSKGYNCAQAVSCAFRDLVDIDEATLFRTTEGLGLGMGGMDGTCGAITAAAVLSGLKCSTAHLDKPDSKVNSYQISRACIQEFKDKNSSVICRELKGVDTKKVLRSCNDCIADAVAIIATRLF
ncbi:MAG: C-GCAxxG-C-C family protein [Hungatella sp.]